LHSFNAPDNWPLGLVAQPAEPACDHCNDTQAINGEVCGWCCDVAYTCKTAACHSFALTADDVTALADAASMALSDQEEYFRSGGLALDCGPQDIADKTAWLRRVSAAVAKLGQAQLAEDYADLARMIDASQIQAVSLTDVCPKPFSLVNLDTDDKPTGFETLDEARAGAAFDRMTHYEIWEGDTIRETVDTTPGPKCTACGRGESICSRNPCAAVVADREA
jgi:hypothetical protein